MKPAYAVRKPGFERMRVTSDIIVRKPNRTVSLYTRATVSPAPPFRQTQLYYQRSVIDHDMIMSSQKVIKQVVEQPKVDTVIQSEQVAPVAGRIFPKLMTTFATLLILVGFASLALTLKSNHAVTQQVKALSDTSSVSSDTKQGSITGSVEMPSEDKPSDGVVVQYSVAATHPRYIQIAKLGGYKSRVLSMGLTDAGAVATPKSVWDAGWYEGSSSPADTTGAALIVGHVAGPTTAGIFYNLHKLESGDEVTITMGDDSVKAYSVVAKEEVVADQMNMNTYMVSKNIDKPGLTLVTCGGEFDPKTNTYDKRTVVFAVVKD